MNLSNKVKSFCKNYIQALNESTKSSKLGMFLGVPMMTFSNPILNRTVAASWDVEDDMSSYADQTAFDAVWVPSGSTIKGNATTDVIDFDTAGVQVCYRDLTSISDTTWISRFKITLTTTGVSLGILWVCMSDNTSSAQTAQDFLALMIYDNDNNINISGDPARRPDQSLTQTALSPQISPSNTTYYCEMKRTSATSFTVTVYSDSGYTTSLGTQTITVDSAINNLRYVKLLGYTSGAMIGTFDDIKIMKTQSTPP